MKNNKDEKTSQEPKIAIVLSSGGMKPASALALFEFLDEQNIEVDLQVGCSGGGLMCALRGMGYSNEKILELCREFASMDIMSKLDYRSFLSIANLPFGRFNIESGLIKSEPPTRMCQKMFGDKQLEELNPQTILQATDMQKGEGVVLSKGSVADAVYAAGSNIPLFPARNIDGRWLGDGAFTSPLPVIEAVKRDADIIIAMVFHDKLVEQPKSFYESILNGMRSFCISLVKSQLSIAIDLHHYEIIVINVPFGKPVAMTGSSQLPYVLELGRKAVEGKKSEILSAIESFKY